MSGAAPESIALPRQGSHRHAHAIDQRPREHPYRQRQTRASSPRAGRSHSRPPGL